MIALFNNFFKKQEVIEIEPKPEFWNGWRVWSDALTAEVNGVEVALVDFHAWTLAGKASLPGTSLAGYVMALAIDDEGVFDSMEFGSLDAALEYFEVL